MEKKDKPKQGKLKKPELPFALPDVPPEPAMLPAQIEPMLQSELKARRYLHTRGVMLVARALAADYGEPVERAELAALLHDCARSLSIEQMQAVARAGRLELDELESGNKSLLHAPVGACMAKMRFGATDGYLLDAIKYHTTGRAGMTRLDAIIYIADMIEPNREPYPALAELRALSEKDLYLTLEAGLQSSILYVGKQGQPLHPRSMEALRWVRELNKARRERGEIK